MFFHNPILLLLKKIMMFTLIVGDLESAGTIMSSLFQTTLNAPTFRVKQDFHNQFFLVLYLSTDLLTLAVL